MDDLDDDAAFDAASSFVFWELDHKWTEVAGFIREGCAEPRFLARLANLIDPDTDPFMGTKLVPIRSRGRPKKFTGAQVGVHGLVARLGTSEESPALRALARDIRSGLDDRLLRPNLADIFDGTASGTARVRFKVLHVGDGRRRSRRTLEIHNFLELHADVFDEKTVEVIAEAIARYNISEETARKYLKDRRRGRTDEELALHREVSKVMREWGYSDYQPLQARSKK